MFWAVDDGFKLYGSQGAPRSFELILKTMDYSLFYTI